MEREEAYCSEIVCDRDQEKCLCDQFNSLKRHPDWILCGRRWLPSDYSIMPGAAQQCQHFIACLFEKCGMKDYSTDDTEVCEKDPPCHGR